MKDLTPLTVLVGPNGSGKSTVFDVFAFLSECFTTGLRKAWDRRGRFKELRSREAEGAITFEVKYREEPDRPVITYHLEIGEDAKGPLVTREWLRRNAADSSQLLVTTHSPFFLNALQPKEVWVLYRDEKGYTQARRAFDMRGVGEFMAHGAKLGHLWMEGHFEVGDPLVNAGAPRDTVLRFRRTAK